MLKGGIWLGLILLVTACSSYIPQYHPAAYTSPLYPVPVSNITNTDQLPLLEERINQMTQSNYGRLILSLDLLGLGKGAQQLGQCSVMLDDDATMQQYHFHKHIPSAVAKFEQLASQPDYFYRTLVRNLKNHIHHYDKVLEASRMDVGKLIKRNMVRYTAANPQIPVTKKQRFLRTAEMSAEPARDPVHDMLSYLALRSDILESMPLGQPMAYPRIVSNYGYRKHPRSGKRKLHKGIDLKATHDQRIYSTGAGKVTFAGRQRGFGRVVQIEHGDGFSTTYAHLSKIFVKKGQRVPFSVPIGIQGSSGNATGKHLHYEIRFNGKALNPAHVLKAGTVCI